MTESEVVEIINYLRKYKTETNKIEAKTASVDFPKKCYDTFSSFSNKYGGIILFGINEEKGFEIEGVYDLNDLQKKVTALCSDSMAPAIRPDILPLKYEGKNILAVKVDELMQNKKPCYYIPKGLNKGSYTRVGDRDEVMTDYEIYALQSYNDHIFEDTRPVRRASIGDLNEEELTKYVNKIKETKPNFAKNDFDKCLKLCGITDTNEEMIYPTLAGVMLFGEYPQTYYPQLFVACVVVPGIELGDTGSMGERFIDNKRIEGTIEEMIAGTMNFLTRNMKTSVIIDSNGQRTNRTEYPLEALREAIANALIHRDYSTQTENAYVSVYMYNDRIEIINPGTLYGTNKLEKLGTATTMEARNPTIVRILEEKGDVIENRHSGIPTMKREMKKFGLPEPEFYEERDSFKVVFRNRNVVHHGQQKSLKSGQQSGQQKPLINDYKVMLLKYCVIPRNAKEISEYLNIKSRQYISTNIIKPLINEGKLEYTNKNSVNARNQKYVSVMNEKIINQENKNN